MRRGGAVLLALVLAGLVLWVPGCRQQETPAEDEDLIVVGVSQVGAESDWRVACSESMKEVFSQENGYRLLFEDAQQKQENQILAIRKFIQLGVDYIVLLPIVEEGWESVLLEAEEAGIPVIVVDRAVDVPSELYETRVGSDFLAEGEMAAAWLEERFAGQSQVSVIHIQGTPGSTAQVGRTAALEAALGRNWNWTLLAQMDGDFTQAKSYEVMVNFLEEHHSPPIDLVYCENDNEAFGTIQALEEYGYVCGAGGVTVVCFDATRNGLRWCMEGRISLVVECDPLLGPLTEQVIQKLEDGEKLKKEYNTAQRCFTPQELTEEFIAQRAY